ncbi:MAG: helix-turn-helix domain-containing protein [Methylocystaceae bacterium]|nr:helix-turn-helix domain-containing protein [Methylocystaceae bacterium]
MSEDENIPIEETKDFLTTFARGLSVIKSFDRHNRSMTLTEVAHKNDMSRASARRFLLTLKALGYVSLKDKKFSLTAKVLELGRSFLETFNLRETIIPLMEEIAEKFDETCSAAILDGVEIVYIARMRMGSTPLSLQVGERLPAYATSAGRVLLSGLPQDQLNNLLEKSEMKQLTPNTICDPEKLREEINKVRRQKYSIVNQELTMGLCAMAVPVYSRDGKIAFCLNISMHSSRVSDDEIINKYIPELQKASGQISKDLP